MCSYSVGSSRLESLLRKTSSSSGSSTTSTSPTPVATISAPMGTSSSSSSRVSSLKASVDKVLLALKNFGRSVPRPRLWPHPGQHPRHPLRSSYPLLSTSGSTVDNMSGSALRVVFLVLFSLSTLACGTSTRTHIFCFGKNKSR